MSQITREKNLLIEARGNSHNRKNAVNTLIFSPTRIWFLAAKNLNYYPKIKRKKDRDLQAL